jgi:hypothetical protein
VWRFRNSFLACKKQKEIGSGTMNALIRKANEYFTGLDQIKCIVPYSEWKLNPSDKESKRELGTKENGVSAAVEQNNRYSGIYDEVIGNGFPVDSL